MSSVYDKKEKVFQIASDIAKEKGLSKLTIRDLAEKSDVAIGSIYNLFGTKEKLVMLLMQDYWIKSIDNVKLESLNKSGGAIEQLEYLYMSLKEVADSFHKDFIKDIVGVNMRNSSINEFTQQYKMDMLDHIKEIILSDESIQNEFDEEFTVDQFSKFILYHYFILLRENREDLGFFKLVLKKTLNVK